MKLSILLFALAFLAYAYGQCNSNGHYANRACACYSGFSGAQCATDLLTPSGCSLSSVSPLTTESVAELLTTPPETRITNNDFVFTLVSPGRTNRYFDSIKLAGNDTCSYPVVPFTHTFNSETALTYACNDVYVGQFSIPEVSACGFTQSSNADFTILSGSIDVIVKDDLGMFRSTAITRTTSSSLAVELKFPSHYTVSSGNLTVVSPIEVYAAVTFQEYDPMNDKLSLVITTSVQWPYVLSSPVLVSSPDASYVVSGPELSFLTCADYSGDCLQETIISFTNITAAGICSITDQVFPFDWNYGCRGDSKDCPVTGTNSVSQVDAHITTGELCSTLTVISGVTGTLNAYASSAFGQTSLAYLANAPVFLKAEINAQVTVQEVTVVDVIVHVGSFSHTIVSGGLSQINFGNLNFQTYKAGLLPNEVGLSFDATYAGDNAIFITSGESIFVFTVDVKVAITYTTSFKRDVVVENMVISKDLVLDASHA